MKQDKKKFIILFGIAAVCIAADQATKLWAHSTLRHACETIESSSGRKLTISKCHDRNLTVQLPSGKFRELSLQKRESSIKWRILKSVRCPGQSDCLAGAVKLFQIPEGALLGPDEKLDSAALAVKIFRGEPIEVDSLADSRWSPIYKIEASAKSGKSHLIFKYKLRVIEVIKRFLHMRYTENRGAAWGFLSNLNQSVRIPIFIFISLLAIGFIFYLFWRITSTQRLLTAALALVLGGALGNFIDRIYSGNVIDFIDVHFMKNQFQRAFTWPTFNIADIAIVVGVFLILLDMLLSYLNKRKLDKKKSRRGAAG